MIKYKFIDLFAGCGGLEDGFLQSGMYIDVAAVEWLKPQVNTLIQRLKTKWQIADASDRVMHFDIQREEELFKGWKDEEFGRGKGLDYFINEADGIDVIIGDHLVRHIRWLGECVMKMVCVTIIEIICLNTI